MTAVLESKGDISLSSTKLDPALPALQAILADQQRRAAEFQRRGDIAFAFVQMGRGLKDCTPLDASEQLGCRATANALPRLTSAAEAFGRIADDHPAVAIKVVLRSLAAECYHLTGERQEAARMATLGLSCQEHPDMGIVIQTRLAICRRVLTGEPLVATTPNELLSVAQDLVLAA